MSDNRESNFSERMGDAVAQGILRGVGFCIIVGIIAALGLTALRNWTGASMDDSDRDSWHRSGMVVRTDALTGRQYLESSAGHLVPRLGANGLQIVVGVKP